MQPKKRSFILSGLLIVLVGVALASGGLQLPALVHVFAGGDAAPARGSAEIARPVPARVVSLQADREEYSPGDAVIFTGSGWQPGEPVKPQVHEWPTIHADRSWTVTADASGEIFDNQLIRGDSKIAYQVTAKGQESGYTRIVILAAASNDFTQCSNANPTLGNCVWIGSNLQQGNSVYAEGMATAQRVLLRTITGTTSHQLKIIISYTDSSKHSYDYLVSWDQASALHNFFLNTPLVFNECGNLQSGGQPPSETQTCNAVVAAAAGDPTKVVDVDVPNDPYVSGIFTADSPRL